MEWKSRRSAWPTLLYYRLKSDCYIRVCCLQIKGFVTCCLPRKSYGRNEKMATEIMVVNSNTIWDQRLRREDERGLVAAGGAG